MLEDLVIVRDFALEAHKGQVDKLGVPYGAHVVHVGESVSRAGPEFEAVGYLHDVVEDCDVTLEEIGDRFGEIVMHGVDAMTRRTGETYAGDYLPRLIRNRIGLVVKYADSRHNYGKIYLLDDTTAAARLRQKYEGVFLKLENVDPRLKRWGDPVDLIFRDGAWRIAD